ncbi:hypothetical protein EV204_101414 [Tissierella praeacuta]|uniref:Qat anti-phage system associated protein QatB n=1 Tax=Tissierella praeacuta TaxID=43131 RepID=UPI001048F25E|nr:Qat anti-phage system associated protein QatB [Tissierella praeacuta]TCU79433.1 hypothetical protein EV204_101414 [Tissierella praeacuta]
MGTSASHSGPKSGVSFDPPWLDDIDNPETPTAPEQSPQETPKAPLLAPPARFKSARQNLGDYIKSGSRDSLKKSLGHYSRTGMGGSRNVANRMRHSANIASKLYSSFSSLREGNEPTISSIISNYRTENTDVYGMIDAIAGYICGDGGSLDEISPINSVSSALSDLFDKNPDINITALSDDNVWSLVSSFLSYEAFSKVQLDIGQGFEAKDIPLADRVSRLNDMREYLESEISSQVNVIRVELGNKPPSDLHNVMMTAIERTFEVFEVTV